MEENHLGQVIQKALIKIPRTAMIQTSPSRLISQYDQAYGRVGSCNEHKDHHVVDLSQQLVDFWGNIQRVVDGAGSIEADHA